MKVAARLGGLALAAGLLLGGAHELTRERVAENSQRHAEARLQAMLPFADAALEPTESGYRLLRGGEAAGFIGRHGSAEGYNGEIAFWLAVDLQGAVLGASIIAHQETPGLGDVIDERKSPWLQRFRGRSLANTRWALRRDGGDLDGITGATITARAMVNAIHDALLNPPPALARADRPHYRRLPLKGGVILAAQEGADD